MNYGVRRMASDLGLLYKIAKLYYIDNLNMKQIAERYRISISTVSRNLQSARDKEIVRILINYDSKMNEEIESNLEERYGIRECYIISSAESQQSVFRDTAKVLEDIFDRYVKDGDYIGVSWGETEKGIFDNLSIRNKKEVNVIPIVGGLGEIETGTNTNSIAKVLATEFEGNGYLIHAPAILDNEEAKKVVQNERNTERILQLWDKLNLAIMGVGITTKDSSLIKHKALTEKEIEYLQNLEVIADVNINFLNREGASVPNNINRKLIRMDLKEIKKVETVIIIAFGNNKAEGIHAVVKGNIADILIIDDNIANTL